MKKAFLKSAVLLVVIFAMYSCGAKSNEGNIANKEENDSALLSENKNVCEEYTKLKISNEEREKLNTFFSNFSEVYMEPFDEQSLTDTKMIDFAVSHNYINNYKSFESSGDNTAKIKKEFIDKSAKKFFGRKITSHQSTEYIKYTNGYYYKEEASGGEYIFSEIEDLFEVSDYYYYAIVNIYIASSGWDGSLTGDDAPELYNQMGAYITKKENKYVLNEYQIFKN
ncbi:MAG: hypothetical protein RBS19_07490 [Bacteroidales bacterium]|nr:hypothetical protein [Bacteroidales bacterium]